MARPKKEKQLTRSHHITLRLTNLEYERIADMAKEAGLSCSNYMRKMLLEKDFCIKYEIVADVPELQKLTGEFGKIGNNLNQIARFFNTGGVRSKAMQDEIHECIVQIFELREEVIKMAGDYHGSIETHRK
ncbi:MAG: plasmid mobilization relaxosome protein MobC [Clostridia bacterium]|nr:plasmid mobilization relaxosome protein MobC [Clostridia bacterium]